MQHLEGRVVIVTGAANGFGRLIAEKCAAGGAKVVGIDLAESDLSVLVDSIRGSGGEASFFAADVTDIEQMEAAARHAVDTYGAIDVIVNNAGIMPLAYFSDHHRAIQRWHNAIDVNIKGVLNGICAVYDQMIEQGRGQVVNISSIYGNAGVEGSAVYSATKAAVTTLSDSLRIEAKGKIKVTTVKPTGVFGTKVYKGMVDRDALVGLTGQRAETFTKRVAAYTKGELPEELGDRDSVQYWLITPDEMADAVVHVIDQPWGISISDITVRASGEDYVY